MGYTAIVLEEKDQNILRERASKLSFPTWEVKCHHCTLHMGEPTEEENEIYNDLVIMVIDAIGISPKAVALRVAKIAHSSGMEISSQNDIPHITILVNVQEGAKAVDSNAITNWHPVEKGGDFLRVVGRLQYCE